MEKTGKTESGKKNIVIFGLIVSFVFMMSNSAVAKNHKKDNSKSIVVNNLDDSLTPGVKSGGGNVNESTQVNNYTEVLVSQLSKVENIELIESNSYLEMDSATRLITIAVLYHRIFGLD